MPVLVVRQQQDSGGIIVRSVYINSFVDQIQIRLTLPALLFIGFVVHVVV